MLLAELVPLSNQAQYKNGAILAGGLLYVYYQGRTALATTYQDPNGVTVNSNPIRLDNEGRCAVFASLDYSYTLVFCDKYGQEQFSYDKELLDAVPVEDTYSIGIKGDDTISVNKSLSGQTVVFNLHAKGEDYAGIEPIVVNNETREISANHKPLGVESPLIFTQDDEEATIIGFDSSALPSAVGPIVQSAISSISGDFATKEDVEKKYDTSSFASISGNFLTAVPEGYATEQYVNDSISGKYDTSAFQSVSGNFLTAVPAGTMNTASFGFNSSGQIVSYGNSAFAGQGAGVDYILIIEDL